MTQAYELPVKYSVGSTYSDGWAESVYPGESYNLKNRIVRNSKNYSSKKSMLTSFTVELMPINLGRDESIRMDLYINNKQQDSVDVVGQGIYTSGDFVSYKLFSKVPAVGKWRVKLSFEGKPFYFKLRAITKHYVIRWYEKNREWLFDHEGLRSDSGCNAYVDDDVDFPSQVCHFFYYFVLRFF